MGDTYPLGKAGHVNVQVGPLVLGVRTNDAEMSQLLRNALQPAVVDVDSEHGNVSLFFGEQKRHTRPLHIVHRRSNRVFSSTDRGEILRCAFDQLDSFSALPGGLMRLDARLISSPAGAVIVCCAFERAVMQWARSTPDGLWRVHQSMYCIVDADAAEAVLRPMVVETDPDGMAVIDTRFPTRQMPWALTERRLPIRAIVISESSTEALTNGSAASSLMTFTQLSAPRGEWLDGAYLEQLSALRERANVVVRGTLDKRALSALLAEISTGR